MLWYINYISCRPIYGDLYVFFVTKYITGVIDCGILVINLWMYLILRFNAITIMERFDSSSNKLWATTFVYIWFTLFWGPMYILLHCGWHLSPTKRCCEHTVLMDDTRHWQKSNPYQMLLPIYGNSLIVYSSLQVKMTIFCLYGW